MNILFKITLGPPAWQASILPLNHRCEHFIRELAFKSFSFSSDGKVVQLHRQWYSVVHICTIVLVLDYMYFM